jgi:cellulose synthase/poly-beta-1,6-N-acetylglucosamine synthase-like glycosyltransferase
MAARVEAMKELPEGVINDGAYLGGTARSRGYSIKHCEDAYVEIDVPTKISSLLSQRRRIIFGHLQTWRMIGKVPRTVESLLVSSPAIALKVLVNSLSRAPKLILALPVATVTEGISAGLAVFDAMRASKKHVVWKRYAA